MAEELTSLEILQDLDARQDDVLAQLDELNERVESVLAEFTTARSSPDEIEESADPVEANVECESAVSQGTDTDSLDSRGSDRSDAVESDAA